MTTENAPVSAISALLWLRTALVQRRDRRRPDVALVAEDGAIDCLTRPDPGLPGVVGALLDAERGCQLPVVHPG